jgi:hypothetical protein
LGRIAIHIRLRWRRPIRTTGRRKAIGHLTWPHRRRARHVSAARHTRHCRCPIGRGLGGSGGHCLTSALSGRSSAKDVGEGILALCRRCWAELGRAGILAALLGVILGHAGWSAIFSGATALWARSLPDIRPCPAGSLASAFSYLRLIANLADPCLYRQSGKEAIAGGVGSLAAAATL